MTGYTTIKEYAGLKGVVVEVGSERGHGSTNFLYNYAKERDMIFKTIDCDPAIHEQAKSLYFSSAILGKGEEILPQLNSICFAYLDAFDYHGDEYEDVPDSRHSHYKEFGYVDASGGESVRVHLEMAKIIEERTADECLIVFDDTNYQPYSVIGKGAFAVPYLIGRGFKVVKAYEHEKLSLAAYVALYREK